METVWVQWDSAKVCQQVNCHALLFLDCDLVTHSLVLQVQDENH